MRTQASNQQPRVVPAISMAFHAAHQTVDTWSTFEQTFEWLLDNGFFSHRPGLDARGFVPLTLPEQLLGVQADPQPQPEVTPPQPEVTPEPPQAATHNESEADDASSLPRL